MRGSYKWFVMTNLERNGQKRKGVRINSCSENENGIGRSGTEVKEVSKNPYPLNFGVSLPDTFMVLSVEMTSLTSFSCQTPPT